MYSTHNERKFVITEELIKTLKNKIYKYMTSISKSVYIDNLGFIVDEYNNTYYRTIKMNPVNVELGTDIKDPKFKVSDHFKNQKYRRLFENYYTQNWSEEAFAIKNVKNSVLWTYVIEDLNVEEIIRTLFQKELQKTNSTELRIEKVIRKKSDKSHVKWKGCND